MKQVLLDTGVVVALLDRSEKQHARCVEAVSAVSEPLITCETVIAESCYLMRNIRGAADAVLANVERGFFQIPFDLSIQTEDVRRLMKKYRSVPMDLADACLVALAEEFETDSILTLDSDFSIYRWGGKNRTFRNLLDG